MADDDKKKRIQDNLERLEHALGNPVKSVEQDGEKVEYQAPSDIIEAHRHLSRMTAARRPLSAIFAFRAGPGDARR